MSTRIDAYLNTKSCPEERPEFTAFNTETTSLHQAIDSSIKNHGQPYLHPNDPTLQLDMLGSRHMADWQERKVEYVFSGEKCWSDLHQFYARYGVETARELIQKIETLEAAKGVLLTDCGMQAIAITFDILAKPGGHAILMRGVYNKSRRYLEWLGNRYKIELSIIDELEQEKIQEEIRKETFMVFGETYTNPRLLALDPQRLGEICLEAKKEKSARSLKLVIDNTIATPWGVKTPLLSYPGVNIVLGSGTKALAGQDRDLWGYIASNQVDFLNEAQDLLAMRGGTLDWRRAEAILKGFDEANARHQSRCESAKMVASFLDSHPLVESVYHPSLPSHPQRQLIDEKYDRHASLMSFRIKDADEAQAKHFADVLAMCKIFRYAGSFDGLTSKVNHHRTVSEYFTQEEELEKAGITRFIRLGIGTEAASDLMACLNWALHNYQKVSEQEVLNWQKSRESELGIRAER